MRIFLHFTHHTVITHVTNYVVSVTYCSLTYCSVSVTYSLLVTGNAFLSLYCHSKARCPEGIGLLPLGSQLRYLGTIRLSRPYQFFKVLTGIGGVTNFRCSGALVL